VENSQNVAAAEPTGCEVSAPEKKKLVAVQKKLTEAKGRAGGKGGAGSLAHQGAQPACLLGNTAFSDLAPGEREIIINDIWMFPFVAERADQESYWKGTERKPARNEPDYNKEPT
jgi:hypothetical protein